MIEHLPLLAGMKRSHFPPRVALVHWKMRQIGSLLKAFTQQTVRMTCPGFFCAFAFAASDVVAADTPADRLNVLFILVDDLNDQIGWLGGAGITPNMDRLAQRGTLFANAHAQAPWCSPSRTSFLTGKRPSTTGIYALTPWFRNVPALRELVTLPQHFAAHGYETFGIGKVYHEGARLPISQRRNLASWVIKQLAETAALEAFRQYSWYASGFWTVS